MRVGGAPRGEPAPRPTEDKIYVRTFVFVRVVSRGPRPTRDGDASTLALTQQIPNRV